jgi:zinc protease
VVDLREATTPSGLKFQYIKSSVQDQVVISFSFPGGTAHDLMKGPQTSFIVGSMMVQSSGGIHLGELKEDLDDLQGGFVLQPLPEHTVGLVLAPAANIAEVVKLGHRVLTKPDFPKKKIKQIRKDAARQNKKLRKRHDIKASLAFINVLGKAHPYGANYVGNPKRIRAVTRDDLIRWHKDRIVRSGLLITIVGNLEEARMANLIDTLFYGLPDKGHVPKIPQVVSKPTPKKPIRLKGTNAQAIIIVGGITGNASNIEDWTASFYLNHILAKGSKSRLFKSVREETGKTYGFSSKLVSYSKIGTVAINGKVSKDNLQKTIGIVKKTIAEFRKNGPTTKEIIDAKSGYASYDAKILKDHVKLAGRYNRWQRHGWSLDAMRNYQEIDKTIDLSDPKYRKMLIPESPVVLIAE